MHVVQDAEPGLVRLSRLARDLLGEAAALDVVASAGPVEADAGLCSSVVVELRDSGAPAVEQGGTRACVAAPVLVAGRVWGSLAAAGPLDAGALPQLARTGDLLGLCVGNALARAQLVELSRTDPLTGAANRRAFTTRVCDELERAQRLGTSTTLALLDLDGFKAVNDQHGHLTGDQGLRELVGRVVAELRTADVLARLGGDEFAVVLPAADDSAASAALERIARAVRDSPLDGVRISASLGAAVVDAGHCSTEDLYRAADRALYRAKARGPGSVVLERLS